MKKLISLFLATFLVAMVFADETNLFSSDSTANLDGYEYISNFEVDSDSGYFVKGKNLAISSSKDGVEAIAWRVPENISTSYKVIPAYPSELNELNDGSGYIKNAASIKKIKIIATLNRPYDDIFLLYSTTPNGEIKKIKMPHYDSAMSMIEQEYIFENPEYIDNEKNRDIKIFPLAGKYKPGIYFRGIQIQTNAPYGIYGYSDLSTLNIKKIAVIYDKAEKDENIVAAEEFEKKYGIDYSKDLKEKTKNIINQKITARNNAKELMDSSENNTENSK